MNGNDVEMVPAPLLKSRTPPDSIVRKLSETERAVAALQNQNRQLAGQVDALSAQVQKFNELLARQTGAAPAVEEIRATIELRIAQLGEELTQRLLSLPRPEPVIIAEPTPSPAPALSAEDLRLAVEAAVGERLAQVRQFAEDGLNNLKVGLEGQLEAIKTTSARAATTVSSYVDSKVQEVSDAAEEYADVVSRRALVSAKECISERLNSEGLSTLKSYVQGELDGIKTQVQGDVDSIRIRIQGELEGIKAYVQGESDSIKVRVQDDVDGIRTHVRGELDSLRTHVNGNLEGIRAAVNEASSAMADRVSGILKSLDERKEGLLTEATSRAVNAVRPLLESLSQEIPSRARECILRELDSRGLTALKAQIQEELESIRAYLAQATSAATSRVEAALQSLDEARDDLLAQATDRAVTAIGPSLNAGSREITTQVKEQAELIAREQAQLVAREQAELVAREQAGVVAREQAEMVAREHAQRVARQHAEQIAREAAAAQAAGAREALLKEITNMMAARISECANAARAYTDQRAEHTLSLAMAHAERNAGAGTGESSGASSKLWLDMKEYIDFRVNDVLQQVKPRPALSDLRDPFTGFGRKF